MLNALQTLHGPLLLVDSTWKLDAFVNMIPTGRASESLKHLRTIRLALKRAEVASVSRLTVPALRGRGDRGREHEEVDFEAEAAQVLPAMARQSPTARHAGRDEPQDQVPRELPPLRSLRAPGARA